jgi:hypothetical protein
VPCPLSNYLHTLNIAVVHHRRGLLVVHQKVAVFWDSIETGPTKDIAKPVARKLWQLLGYSEGEPAQPVCTRIG